MVAASLQLLLVFAALSSALVRGNRAVLRLDDEPEDPDWLDRGSHLCGREQRKELPNAASLGDCGYHALLDPDCKQEPPEIYVRRTEGPAGRSPAGERVSLACRCVRKGEACRPGKLGGKPATLFARAEGSAVPPVAEARLNLLVTRHGLSCANLVNDWKSGLGSLGHAWMLDPLLAGAGRVGAVRAAAEIKGWLEERGLKIDAVLSSVLLRAMQTAALEYPRELWSARNGTAVLHVAPFLKEHGFGKDNQADELKEQVDRSAWEEQGLLSINDRFARLLDRDSAGDWAAFKDFLAEYFLPSQWPHGLSGKQLTLAVVTHSNFMNSGEIAEKCKDFYPMQHGKPKAWNNQVLAIPYRLRVLKPENGGAAYFRLEEGQYEAKCEPVAKGMAIPVNPRDGQPWELCEQDIGRDCEYVKGITTREQRAKEMVGKEEDQINDYLGERCLTGNFPGH